MRAWLFLALAGCYAGSARSVTPAALDADPGWVRVRGVPFVAQKTDSDCGPAALAMVLRFWGVAEGEGGGAATAGELRDRARRRGLQAFLIKGEPQDLRDGLSRGRPLIVGLGKQYGRKTLGHFEVLVGFHPGKKSFLTLDPASGWRENGAEGFAREWAASEQLLLIVLPP